MQAWVSLYLSFSSLSRIHTTLRNTSDRRGEIGSFVRSTIAARAGAKSFLSTCPSHKLVIRFPVSGCVQKTFFCYATAFHPREIRRPARSRSCTKQEEQGRRRPRRRECSSQSPTQSPMQDHERDQSTSGKRPWRNQDRSTSCRCAWGLGVHAQRLREGRKRRRIGRRS